MKRILPSYPLFVKDPYFSIWSAGDVLNESDVTFWTGEKKGVVGAVEINGMAYVFLGNPDGAVKIPQKSLKITAYTTDYVFENEWIKLSVSFVSPLPLDDKALLSCPVCYMRYDIEKKKPCDTRIAVAINADLCYNRRSRDIHGFRGGVMNLEDFDVAWLGLRRQAPLSHTDDSVGADWGYFYISGEETKYTPYPFAGINNPCGRDDAWAASYSKADRGMIMVGFDDLVSINYFGDYLRGYYFKDGKTIVDALNETYRNADAINRKLAAEDRRLRVAAKKHGADHLDIIYASLRQSIAAHKLVEDREGNLIFLSKECNSNGCIGTVDVSYPSIPLYLLADTEYVKGMMRPIFKFSKMPVWEYDFAPHDVGTYPICSGQVYGLKKEGREYPRRGFPETHPDYYLFPKGSDVYEFDMQMPVEECANMIIMVAACYAIDKDLDFVKGNFDLLEKWVEYLIRYGLRPENQLCTDDFAGHLANNVNLAVKATVGIGCFAELAKAVGREWKNYREKAESFAAEIEAFGKANGHIPLTWDDGTESFSLKYNLLFDKLLSLGLFSEECIATESEEYIRRLDTYGVALDSRSGRAKTDWLIWIAAITENEELKREILARICKYMREGSDRIPFGDYYYADTGVRRNFANRTVQGGCFALLLRDRMLKK